MRRAVLAIVLVFAAAATGLAQEQPVFRAGVDLVTVDAIVVDKDGRPLTGLTADDFVLTVDGKPRAIDTFELISVRALDAPADARLPDVSSNDVAEPGRVIILVIDRNNMRIGDGRAALEGLKGLIDNLSPRDRLGLVTLPGGGPAIQPTGDHQAVMAAVGRIRGMQPQEVDPLMVMTINEAMKIDRGIPGSMTSVTDRNCTGGGQARPGETDEFQGGSGLVTPYEQCRMRIQSTAKRMVSEMRGDNRATLAAMDSLLEGLRDFEARKTIVYISNGIVFDFQSEGLLRDLGGKVAALGATFYAIQLYSPPMEATTSGLLPDWDEDRRVRADGLDYLAGVSGGALFRPGAGLGVTPERIARETSARYALGFQVQPAERDARRHTIKVALRRERGVTVRARTEFTVEPGTRRFVRQPETLSAALNAMVPLPAVPIRVATSLVPDGSAQPKVLLAAAVGPDALLGRRAHTRFAYDVLDVEGQRLGGTEEVDATTPFYTVALRLKPGRYRVKLAAKDESGRIGTVEHPFEVWAPPENGYHLGGPLLFRDNGNAAPIVLVDVPEGEPHVGLHAFLHAGAPASPDALAAVVEVSDVGEHVTRFNGPMTVSCGADGQPASDCELNADLPTARWPAGPYRAEVTLLRGGATVGRTTRTFSLIDTGRDRGETTSATPAVPLARPATLDALLSRGTAYVDRYSNRAVSTVAEERYVQAILDNPAFDRTEALAWQDGEPHRRGLGVSARRQINADLLMVKTDNGLFTNYRDVSAVDGKPVKDRGQRALSLFTAGGAAPAHTTLNQVAQEGARYNLGTLRRTLNVPTLPLFVLHPRHVGRFAFEPAGTETVDGVATTIVRFREKRGPTFVRTTRGDDVFVNGRLWLADDGRVIKTALVVDERDTGVKVRIDVVYRDAPNLGLLMPVEMRESYTNLPGDRMRSIEGRATYSNFRAFTVITNETTGATGDVR